MNKGSQAHEVVVVQLARRATVNAFLEDFQPGVPGFLEIISGTGYVSSKSNRPSGDLHVRIRGDFVVFRH